MSKRVVTGRIRFSYLHIFKPYRFHPEDPEKYSATILIPKKDKKTLKLIRDAIEEATEDGVLSKWKGKKPSNLWNPLRDGDEKEDGGPEYEGMYYVNCKSTTKPQIVDADLMEILDPEEVYSGCYGRVSITFYPFDNSGTKGIAAALNNVQKLSDGDRLGGGFIDADKEFDDGYRDEEDEDEF